MADDKPVWRKMFDTMEGGARGPVEDWANSEQFSNMLLNASTRWNDLNQTTQEHLAKLMHAANVPAYSDIAKLTRMVGSLTSKIDGLEARLEDMQEQLTEVCERLEENRKSAAPTSAGRANRK